MVFRNRVFKEMVNVIRVRLLRSMTSVLMEGGNLDRHTEGRPGRNTKEKMAIYIKEESLKKPTPPTKELQPPELYDQMPVFRPLSLWYFVTAA